RRSMGDYDIDVEPDELREQGGQPLIMSVRPPKLDDNVATFLIAEIAQSGPKCFRPLGQTIGRREAYKADAKNPTRLLRSRRERPRSCRAADQCEEFPASHKCPPEDSPHRVTAVRSLEHV